MVELLIVLVIIAIFFGLFYLYGKFLGTFLIKREKKRIEQKNPTDEQILKFYKNYNPSNAWIFFLFGIACYFPLKAAYQEVRSLYEVEAERRGLPLSN